MQEFTLNITISEDGETVEGQVEGMKGHKCEDVQHVLDQIGQELEHHRTHEYDEKEPVRIVGKANDDTVHLGGW